MSGCRLSWVFPGQFCWKLLRLFHHDTFQFVFFVTLHKGMEVFTGLDPRKTYFRAPKWARFLTLHA